MSKTKEDKSSVMNKGSVNSKNKNDWVVHSYHGVSHIEGIDKKSLNGKEQTFFKMKTTELTYWLPVNSINASHIRKISSISILNKALVEIQKKPKTLGSDFRERKTIIQNGFSDGDIFVKAELIRDLNGRVAQHRDNIYEGKMLDDLKQQFAEEWAIANNCNQKEAQEILNRALITSESKLETT